MNLGSLYYTLGIKDLTGQQLQQIQNKLKNLNIDINLDPQKVADSVKKAVAQVKSQSVGLQADKQALTNSIENALKNHKFPIQIQVLHDQARMAVQNALQGAANVNKNDTIKAKNLATAELKMQQAELAKLRAAHLGAASGAREHTSASVNLGGALGSNLKISGELGATMASLYSVHAAKAFLQQIVEIGGELEHQKIAMRTIFGDEGKQIELFGKIKTLARNSPFGVMELTASTKALSAYGVEYNEIYDTAKRLADISAATSVDINRLILAFGKTKSRGFLDGLEAKQFAYANIPIYEMIRKKLEQVEGQAVTTAEVMSRIKKREIGFDTVKDVLWDITDQGGKFYNMQEALAGSVKTSWKLVKDNLDLMFGDMAEGPVGQGLKSLAELLQGLTRNWQTIGAVLAANAAAMGVVKAVTLATNSVLGQHNVTLLQNVATNNAKTIALAKQATTYRVLTAEEQTALTAKKAIALADTKWLFTRRALTAEETASLVNSKAMTRDLANRLAATGRLSVGSLKLLASQGLLTQQDIAHLRVLRNKNGWFSKILQSMGMQQRNASALTMRFTLLNNAIGASLKQLGAFIFNPWTIAIAAISTMASLWQNNNQEMERAAQLADNIKEKAKGGAEAIAGILKSNGGSDGLTNLQLENGIDTLKSAIKDYSPTPIKDINAALVTEQGEVATLAQQYDNLRAKVVELGKAYETAGDKRIGGIIQDSIDKTNDGWFNDDVITNAKDYTNAMKKMSSALSKVISDDTIYAQRAINEAVNKFPDFAVIANNLTSLEAKVKAFDDYMRSRGGYTKWVDLGLDMNSSILNLYQNRQIGTGPKFALAKDARQNFMDDVKTQVQAIKTQVKQTWDKEISDLKPDEKLSLVTMIKNMIDTAEGVSDDVKREWAQALEKGLNVKIIDDEISPKWKKAFSDALAGSLDAATEKAVLQMETKGYNSLNSAQKQLIQKLAQKAQEDLISEFPELKAQIQKWLNENTLTWRINTYVADAQNNTPQLVKDIIDKKGLQGYTRKIGDYLTKWAGEDGSAVALQKAAADDVDNAKKEVAILEKSVGTSAQSYIDAKKKLDDMLAAAKYADINTNKKKGSGSQKDTVAEQFKQQLSDIKDAWSQFQQWSTSVGKQSAMDVIADSGLFSKLPQSDIPRTLEEYSKALEKLEEQLKASGIKGHSQREALLNQIITLRLQVNKSIIEKDMTAAVNYAKDVAEREIANWNIYDKIFKATGNKELASSLAFGSQIDVETYPEMIKRQFQEVVEARRKAFPDGDKELEGLTYDSVTQESLLQLPKDLQDAWKSAHDNIKNYFDQQRQELEEIVTSYQSTSDKIAAIESERQTKVATVKSASGLTDAQKEQLINRINAEAGYKKLTQSEEYLKFFNNIYGITLDAANQIGDAIQANLNAKLQAGLITIYEYEQEMEKVRNQINSIRNIRSDTFTFMTGGFKALNKQKLQKEEGKLANNTNYQNKLKELQSAQLALNNLQGEGQEAERQAQEKKIENLKLELSQYTKQRDAIVANMNQWDKFTSVMDLSSSMSKSLSAGLNMVKSLASSSSVDTTKGGWKSVTDTFSIIQTGLEGMQQISNAMAQDDAGAMMTAAANTVSSIAGQIAASKDADVDEKVQNSRKWYNIMEGMIEHLSNVIEHSLGSNSSYYLQQKDLMEQQKEELIKQRDWEQEKKDTDDDAVGEYEKSIQELQDSLTYLAEETANTLYGIDIKGWASDLGDALYEAWQKGEDGAEAFKSTAKDIIGDVTNEMLKIGILEPMFQKIQDYLFGVGDNYGSSGAFGTDFELDESEVKYMADLLMQGMSSVNAYENALNNLEDYMDKYYGISLKDDDSSSSTTESIQGVTEDTAGLIASYMNAIRLDTSVIRLCETTNSEYLQSAITQMTQISVTAQAQLTYQQQIAANTKQSALTVDSIYQILKKVTNGTSTIYVQ